MTSLWLDGRTPRTASVLSPKPVSVIVIGGGITGLSTAVMLAEAGERLLVLEAQYPGAVATGNTTAKVSLLQGTRLSTIAQHHPASLVKAYVDANRDGQQWVERFCADHGVRVERRLAVTYANTRAGVDSIDREYRAARIAGLAVRRVDDAGLPFATTAAVELDDQLQFDPIDFVDALHARLDELGSTVLSGVTVTGVSASDPCVIESNAGRFESASVVLATGAPILDRGLYFAKTTGLRSYALAFQVPGPVPQGMYLAADEPDRSLRTARVGGRDYLIVGGNGHEVGRHPSPASLVADLEAWTLEHFPGATRTHTWSAQDYASDDEMPFVGRLPRGRGRIWVATGFSKWGMTNGPAAAIRIAAEILGEEPRPWATTIGTRITVPADLAEGAIEGAKTAREAVVGRVRAATASSSVPSEGEGVVSGIVHPVATSTVGGVTRSVSAVCPHLGGLVTWNDAECSWDCPLHASRFAATGERIEGPAVTGLAPVSDPA